MDGGGPRDNGGYRVGGFVAWVERGPARVGRGPDSDAVLRRSYAGAVHAARGLLPFARPGMRLHPKPLLHGGH